MKVEITPQHMKGPGINIDGAHVTPLVWDLFHYSISANRDDCRWAQACKEAGAFFQGGSFDRNGEWVFIEFWKPGNTTKYLELINNALAFLDDMGKPIEVLFVSEDEDLVRWFKDFTNFYGYPVTADGQTGYTFTPKDADAITTMVDKSFTHSDIFTGLNKV